MTELLSSIIEYVAARRDLIYVYHTVGWEGAILNILVSLTIIN